MSYKLVEIDGVGPVILRKRRGSKRLRLSVGHDGQATVSLPYWVPYKLAEEFARSKQAWLQELLIANKPHVFKDGESVGKAHRISIVNSASSKARSVVQNQVIKVYLPVNMDSNSDSAQKVLIAGCQRALKAEAKQLLPQRLAQAAKNSGYSYKSVHIKQLTSRWGSCSHDKRIVLNSYLMQMPWDLIDYVIMHELAHTKVMAHGPRFWNELSQHVPDLTQKRKFIKQYSPRLVPRATPMA